MNKKMDRNKVDSRIFPSFVMNAVEDRRLLIVRLAVLPLKHFGFVK